MRRLEVFTIYEKPADYPDCFAVRRWLFEGPVPIAAELHLADSLDEARRLVPAGLVRLPRDPKDPPGMVESWL